MINSELKPEKPANVFAQEKNSKWNNTATNITAHLEPSFEKCHLHCLTSILFHPQKLKRTLKVHSLRRAKKPLMGVEKNSRNKPCDLQS